MQISSNGVVMAIVTYFIMMLQKTADQSLLYEEYSYDDDVAINFVDKFD